MRRASETLRTPECAVLTSALDPSGLVAALDILRLAIGFARLEVRAVQGGGAL